MSGGTNCLMDARQHLSPNHIGQGIMPHSQQQQQQAQPQQAQMLSPNLPQMHYNNMQSPTSGLMYYNTTNCNTGLTPISPSTSNPSTMHSPQQPIVMQSNYLQNTYNNDGHTTSVSNGKQENICDMISSLMTYDTDELSVNNANNPALFHNHNYNVEQKPPSSVVPNSSMDWYNRSSNTNSYAAQQHNSNPSAYFQHNEIAMVSPNQRTYPTSANNFTNNNEFDKMTWSVMPETPRRKDSLPLITNL